MCLYPRSLDSVGSYKLLNDTYCDGGSYILEAWHFDCFRLEDFYWFGKATSVCFGFFENLTFSVKQVNDPISCFELHMVNKQIH